jgi:hypothetical protein
LLRLVHDPSPNAAPWCGRWRCTVGEIRQALDALRTDPLHREHYTNFLADLVYGERMEFGEAMGTVNSLAKAVWPADLQIKG